MSTGCIHRGQLAAAYPFCRCRLGGTRTCTEARQVKRKWRRGVIGTWGASSSASGDGAGREGGRNGSGNVFIGEGSRPVICRGRFPIDPTPRAVAEASQRSVTCRRVGQADKDISLLPTLLPFQPLGATYTNPEDASCPADTMTTTKTTRTSTST